MRPSHTVSRRLIGLKDRKRSVFAVGQVALTILVLSCDAETRSGPTSTETASLSQHGLQTPPLPLEQQAERALNDRRARSRRIDTLKARLAANAAPATAAVDLEEIRKLARDETNDIEGLDRNTAPVPQLRPSQAEIDARRRLAQKMNLFDMSKPDDVAAWTALKKKELGE